MNWHDWNAFWAMNGYGFFVWGAYGVTALVLGAEVALIRRRHRRARAQISRGTFDRSALPS